MSEQKPPYESPEVEELDADGDTIATSPGQVTGPA
jgi:hypothetical protein